jgi:endonuclease YncB( thermonuclease family)
MQPRETITNLAITCALVFLIVIAAIVLRDCRPVTAAIPVTVPRVVKAQPAGPVAPIPNGKAMRPVEQRFLTFPNPTLVNSPADEADTFQLRVGDEVHMFVLYYVDALDASPTHPERVSAQARYFGKTTQDAVIQTGKEAHDYVEGLLKTRPFRLLTRWEHQPNTERYYALILVEFEKGRWTYLADLLVRQGYARVEGVTTPLPDDKRSVDAYLNELRAHAKYAREKRLGIWSRGK